LDELQAAAGGCISCSLFFNVDGCYLGPISGLIPEIISSVAEMFLAMTGRAQRLNINPP
jgi:hypothetical protein